MRLGITCLAVVLLLVSGCGRLGFGLLDGATPPDAPPGLDSSRMDSALDAPTDTLMDADAVADALVDAESGIADGGIAGFTRSGRYTGDGLDGRLIIAGINPVAVIVKPVDPPALQAVLRTASMRADSSKPMGRDEPMATDAILSFVANGFTVGTSVLVNEPGRLYAWAAIPGGPGVGTGAYIGNGTAQSIAGVGFSPAWVFFADEEDGALVANYGGASGETFRMDPVAGANDGVTSFDADGFTVGARPFVNSDGRRFHYLAFGRTADISIGTYVGDGVMTRTVSGVGLLPSLVIVRSDGTDGGYHQHAWGDSGTMPLFQGPLLPEGISNFAPDSFRITNAPSLNTGGTTYHYLVLTGP